MLKGLFFFFKYNQNKILTAISYRRGHLPGLTGKLERPLTKKALDGIG
jgi:hypothetical protein